MEFICISSIQVDSHVGQNVEPTRAPQEKVDECQGKKRIEDIQKVVSDDIPIAQIMKRNCDDTNRRTKDDEEET